MFQIYDEDRLLAEVLQRATKPIARFKARKPELPRARTYDGRGGEVSDAAAAE